jgi:hypothetical protein
MPAEEPWVVFKTVHPSWGTLILPSEVSELMGVPPPLEKGERPDPARRTLAFLDRGPGRVRVISLFRSAQVFAEAVEERRLIGQAQVSDKLYLNLPDAVEDHLNLKRWFVPERRSQRTNDMLAWMIPAEEYYAWREATQDRSPHVLPPSGPANIYLVKSYFPGLLPSKESMEGQVKGAVSSRRPSLAASDTPRARRMRDHPQGRDGSGAQPRS